MVSMGRYCKAYPICRFREFAGWNENAGNARKEKRRNGDQEVEVPRQLTETAFLYLQENYVVTDGMFKDENIIFDQVTPAWKEFCRDRLKFTPLVEGADGG